MSAGAFRQPQVVLLVEDPDRSLAFYRRLGFAEVFRTPPEGAPIHVDAVLDGVRLGFASRASVVDDHGLVAAGGAGRAAVVVWTDDVPAAVERLTADGVRVLKAPAPWLGRLLVAWCEDPDGHLVQLVQEA